MPGDLDERPDALVVGHIGRHLPPFVSGLEPGEQVVLARPMTHLVVLVYLTIDGIQQLAEPLNPLRAEKFGDTAPHWNLCQNPFLSSVMSTSADAYYTKNKTNLQTMGYAYFPTRSNLEISPSSSI